MYEKFYELLNARRLRELKTELDGTNEIDIAEFLSELPEEQAAVVFRMLKKDTSSEIFSNMSPELQQHLIRSFTDRELHVLIEDLYVDDAVDILEEMPAGIVKRVLKNAESDTRETINRFLSYPENSAGSVMTAEFLDLEKDWSCARAMEHIRRTGMDSETVYTCYVTDASHILLGVVGFRELLYAGEDTPVEKIMDEDVTSVRTTDDREYAVHQLARYDLLAIPVTDAEGRLVGIITADDAFDVMEDESTEDFHKMAAVTPMEKPYLKLSVWQLYLARIPWLTVLMLSSTVSGLILTHFSPVIAMFPLLAAFMPLITATGGNAGAQSSTLVIRGMAVDEIELSDVWRVLSKELRVGAVCGTLLALVNFVRMLIMYSAQTNCIALSALTSGCLLATVVLAKVTGGLLPMLMKKLGGDPAIMASPFITTIVDALSLLLYFGLASAIFM